MRVLIMGAGAIGCVYGAMLHAHGHAVTFVARGDHLIAMRERGLTFEGDGIVGHVHLIDAVASPAEAGGVFDLVLFTVKAYDTEMAAPTLQSVIGPQTVIVPLQNGVEGADRAGASLGMEHVLIGTAMVTATVVSPGVVVQTGTHCAITLAESSGAITPRLERIAAALRDAGIDVTVSDDPRRAVWQKFVGLAPTATIASACGCAIGPILHILESAALFRTLIEETVAVGRAVGVSFPSETTDTIMNMLRTIPDEKPSMLTDYERKRRVELEYITGAVVRIGQSHGIPTPAYDTLYAILKVRAHGIAACVAQS